MSQVIIRAPEGLDRVRSLWLDTIQVDIDGVYSPDESVREWATKSGMEVLESPPEDPSQTILIHPATPEQIEEAHSYGASVINGPVDPREEDYLNYVLTTFDGVIESVECPD